MKANIVGFLLALVCAVIVVGYVFALLLPVILIVIVGAVTWAIWPRDKNGETGPVATVLLWLLVIGLILFNIWGLCTGRFDSLFAGIKQAV